MTRGNLQRDERGDEMEFNWTGRGLGPPVALQERDEQPWVVAMGSESSGNFWRGGIVEPERQELPCGERSAMRLWWSESLS